MHILFYVGLILLVGLVAGKAVSKIKLPEVTGYLLGGVLIGGSFLKIIPHDIVGQLSIISEVALGFIAFSIGSELKISHIKKVGKGIVIITLFEALSAVILVTLVMFTIGGKDLGFSIVIGAIAAATAPAATLMVIRQYKAKGPVVNTLLPIVAMDDAVGIIVFGVSITVAKGLSSIGGEVTLFNMLVEPIMEIILAVVIGIGIGIISAFISRKTTGGDNLLALTIGIVFISVGISSHFNVSPLLLCMAIGTTLSNIMPNSKRALEVVDRFTPPIFIAFFTFAGAELDLSILLKVGMAGVLYIVVRVIGKVVGAGLGAKIAKSPQSVQQYLGLTLVPQAGVAIGLAMAAQEALPTHGMEIRAIILGATVVYELVGPLLTKMALTKAGEIDKNIIPTTVSA
ncbi:cation:proton antiporter [Oceanirhabdus seepicola]|uniref:Cation:proton antiporter n=1 Tax=Oceanirhabdus seepicola TaxID=2828781 RepID=A0A9J6NYG2_9CLOT|nr:cation:proton antiporter [Oceanirhabdus seepicola]MCM1989092.1 cation:proton antiporter [Oceanirhabdus seepicola]